MLANRVKQLVRVYSSIEKKLDSKEINIILSGKSVIRNLNKTFRKEDKATDILSFPLDSQIFGELWLCPEIILENSKKFDEDFEEELLRITIHGLLHLSGYDHERFFDKE
ncbi:MAG: rRNA maturation RNase YbeY, partial [bacterium]